MKDILRAGGEFNEPIGREQQMKRSYLRSAQELMESQPDIAKQQPFQEVSCIIEYGLVTNNFHLPPASVKEAIIHEGSESLVSTPGSTRIALRTPSTTISEEGVTNMLASLTLADENARTAARKHGAQLVRSGVNPLGAVTDIPVSSSDQDEQIVSFYNGRRRSGVLPVVGDEKKVSVDDARVAWLLNTARCRLKVPTLADAITLVNYSNALSPAIIALSGNARFLHGIDTEQTDFRSQILKLVHDTRSPKDLEFDIPTRVGLPKEYYDSAQAYFADVSRYPFIIFDEANAFEIGNTLFERDTKILGDTETLFVEFSTIPTQPTPHETAAMMFFYIGRLARAVQHNEPLPKISTVQSNRAQAAKHGMEGSFWEENDKHVYTEKPLKEVVKHEVILAEEGLHSLGVEQSTIDSIFAPLYRRIKDGESPSDTLLMKSQFFQAWGVEEEEALIMALNELGHII